MPITLAGEPLAQVSAGMTLEPRHNLPFWSLPAQGLKHFFGRWTIPAIDITFQSPERPITSRTESDTERSDHFPINIGLGKREHANTIIKNVISRDNNRSALLLETGDPVDDIIRSLERATKKVRIRKGPSGPQPHDAPSFSDAEASAVSFPKAAV